VDKLISDDPPDGVFYAGNWLTVPPDLRLFYELVQRVVIEFHLRRIEFIERLNRHKKLESTVE